MKSQQTGQHPARSRIIMTFPAVSAARQLLVEMKIENP
jgi:hypothetical protein